MKNTIGIFCLNNSLKHLLTRRLAPHFALEFVDSYEAALKLIENMEIIGLMVHPVKDDDCLLMQFCDLGGEIK